MSDAQRRAVELAQFYFRRLAQEAGAAWDSDNDVEIELMVSHIGDAAAERLHPHLDDAVKRIRRLEDDLARQIATVLGELRMLDGLRPTCVFCMDAAADRRTSRGPACTDCAGDPPDGVPDPDRLETWSFAGPEPGGECPGCVGRGTGTICAACALPIPERLRRELGDALEYDPTRPSCAQGIRHSHQPEASADGGEPGRPDEGPEPKPRDLGPEVGDAGGMSEYRYPWPEDYQRGM